MGSASPLPERLAGNGERVLIRRAAFLEWGARPTTNRIFCFHVLFYGFHYFERDKTVSLNGNKMVTRIIFGRIWSEVIFVIID